MATARRQPHFDLFDPSFCFMPNQETGSAFSSKHHRLPFSQRVFSCLAFVLKKDEEIGIICDSRLPSSQFFLGTELAPTARLP